jgi:hypothetical protein
MMLAPYGFPYPYRPVVPYGQMLPVAPPRPMQIQESPQPTISRIILSDKTPVFRWSVAGQYFVTGLLAPITGLFESVQSFVLGTGVIAGGFALYRATKGKIAPMYMALAMGIGLFRLVKGGTDYWTATTPNEKEESFFSLGNAVSIMGLCALGMRNPFQESSSAPQKPIGFKSSPGLNSWQKKLRFALTNPIDDCLCLFSQHKSPQIPAVISKVFAVDNE